MKLKVDVISKSKNSKANNMVTAPPLTFLHGKRTLWRLLASTVLLLFYYFNTLKHPIQALIMCNFFIYIM